jgi:hypothetical protein
MPARRSFFGVASDENSLKKKKKRKEKRRETRQKFGEITENEALIKAPRHPLHIRRRACARYIALYVCSETGEKVCGGGITFEA